LTTKNLVINSRTPIINWKRASKLEETTHACYVNKCIIIHRYCSKWIIMQRKGRVLNELRYKTGREKERLTWSAGAPLFLLLFFWSFFSVFLFLFCLLSSPVLLFWVWKSPPLCFCSWSSLSPPVQCAPPCSFSLFVLPVSFSVKPPVLGLFLVSSPCFVLLPFALVQCTRPPCVYFLSCAPPFSYGFSLVSGFSPWYSSVRSFVPPCVAFSLAFIARECQAFVHRGGEG